MRITVHFLAHMLREATGVNHCELDVPDGAKLEQVVDYLCARYPTLDGQQEGWHFAVNRTHVEINTVLRSGDDISIFPYIAGG